jgi:release factor glutamine methyltransferase
MKIKDYRTQFIHVLTQFMMQKRKVFYLILEEKQKLKRIDLALQPDLLFLKKKLSFGIRFLRN